MNSQAQKTTSQKQETTSMEKQNYHNRPNRFSSKTLFTLNSSITLTSCLVITPPIANAIKQLVHKITKDTETMFVDYTSSDNPPTFREDQQKFKDWRGRMRDVVRLFELVKHSLLFIINPQSGSVPSHEAVDSIQALTEKSAKLEIDQIAQIIPQTSDFSFILS